MELRRPRRGVLLDAARAPHPHSPIDGMHFTLADTFWLIEVFNRAALSFTGLWRRPSPPSIPSPSLMKIPSSYSAAIVAGVAFFFTMGCENAPADYGPGAMA